MSAQVVWWLLDLLYPISFCYLKVSLFIGASQDPVPFGTSGSWEGLFEAFLLQAAGMIPVCLIFCNVQHNTPAGCGGVSPDLLRRICRWCPILLRCSLSRQCVRNLVIALRLILLRFKFAKEIFGLPQSWTCLPVRCSLFFFRFIKFFLDVESVGLMPISCQSICFFIPLYSEEGYLAVPS